MLRCVGLALVLTAAALVAACDDDPAPATPDADVQGEDVAASEVQDDATAGDASTHDAVTPDAGPDDVPQLLPQVCVLEADSDPDFATTIGCEGDFAQLASLPLTAAIPGARSVKTVIDRVDGNALYFQNTQRYPIHWDFATAHLSGMGKPPVPPLQQFNTTEYFSPTRRFILGALTHYAGPDLWVYEISPYDTATADLIETAFDAIRDAGFFGPVIGFHPTSVAVEVEAAKLPDDIRLVSTDEIFAGITYQPLNLGRSVGRLRFMTTEQLESAPLDFRDLVVLDGVPNDIGVVAGIITNAYQTPLAHINVLSQNRGTPNMALIGAMDDPALRALEGQWVELTVKPEDYAVKAVTQADADAWWEANKPTPIVLPPMSLEVTALVDAEDLLDLESMTLEQALAAAIPAYGGKASQFAALTHVGAKVPTPRGFAIPLAHYHAFMKHNGLDVNVAAMLQDDKFRGDPVYRDQVLAALRHAIEQAPVPADFETQLMAKLAADFPGQRMRFRSSTNAEDLDGFSGAGLYTSKSGDPNDPDKPILKAVQEVWASVWSSRAYQEREYRSIDHLNVGMALLSHPSYPTEAANGVALTANIFDTTGLEPGFYVNVQKGGASVVIPDPGTTTDSFIYYYEMSGQPVVFLSRSNLVGPGETVLTNAQTYALGQGLDAIHKFFKPVYGKTPGKFFAMDVEFKFDAPTPGEPPTLVIKQARPHPGWGLGAGE